MGLMLKVAHSHDWLPTGGLAGPLTYWWFLQVVWVSHSMVALSERVCPNNKHSQGPGRTCKASYELVLEV